MNTAKHFAPNMTSHNITLQKCVAQQAARIAAKAQKLADKAARKAKRAADRVKRREVRADANARGRSIIIPIIIPISNVPRRPMKLQARSALRELGNMRKEDSLLVLLLLKKLRLSTHPYLQHLLTNNCFIQMRDPSAWSHLPHFICTITDAAIEGE